MESNKTCEEIISIFEAHERYGGAVILLEDCERVPPTYSGYKMVFTFADSTQNHLLSLKTIIDGLGKIGVLNSLEYYGLKGSRDNQWIPELHFNVTTRDGNYEIIFALPDQTQQKNN